MASKAIFDYGKCHYNPGLIWKLFVRWLGCLEQSWEPRNSKSDVSTHFNTGCFVWKKHLFSLFPLMYMKFKPAKVSCLVCFPSCGGTLHFEANKDLILNSNQWLNSSRPIFIICGARMITFNDVVVLGVMSYNTWKESNGTCCVGRILQ